MYERHSDELLDHPVLVVALEGWVDAGLGAEGAVTSLLENQSTRLLATFDGDILIDQRARRPMVRINEGVNEGLTWPSIQMRTSTDRQGQDICLLVGPEPDFRWKPFTEAVVELAQSLSVRMVVGLGAFPAPAPHTRPVRLAATAPLQSAEMVGEIGVVQGIIDVPSGVWGALELAFGIADIPVVGLWARVPHYVAGMAYPAASAALIDGLAEVAGLSLDTTDLRTSGDATTQQVDALITRSSDHRAMVAKLEQSVDETEGNPFDLGHLPTGDEIAAELERYLVGGDLTLDLMGEADLEDDQSGPGIEPGTPVEISGSTAPSAPETSGSSEAGTSEPTGSPGDTNDLEVSTPTEESKTSGEADGD